MTDNCGVTAIIANRRSKLATKPKTAPQQFTLKHDQIDHCFKAEFMPQSANKESRTIDVIFSAGNKVIRSSYFSDPYYLQLQIDENSVKLDRLNNGAPLLDSHKDWQLADQIGVVEKAWIKDGLAYATIRFSKRAGVEDIWQDVLDGIYRGISPGLSILSWEEIHKDDEKYMTLLATEWEPRELTLCPVQADPGAHTLSDQTPTINHDQLKDSGDDMKKTADQKPAPEKNEQLSEEKAAELKAEAVKAERLRATDIRNAVKKAKLSDEYAVELIDKGVSSEEAHKLIIDKWAEQDKDAAPQRTQNLMVTQDEGQVRVDSMENALMHRANPRAVELSEAGRRYRGLTLMELARTCLNAHGIRHEGKSKMEVAKLAMHSTSDFPSVLANAAGKALRNSYEATPQTFRGWTSESTASDFKTMSRTQLHGLSLQEVPEGAEITRGTISDSKEEYALATYARIIAITRQTIINDDLDAFSRLPRKFGVAAANLESDVVYAILTANGNMADGTALFHGDHNNLGTGGAISATTLTEMRADMRGQTDDNGVRLNIIPKFLIVPASLETTAKQYVATEVNPTQPSEVNVFKNAFEVVVEPRLDSTDTTDWFVAADPNQIDTIEIAYLDGQRGLYLEERMGFDVDGLEVKGRLDFAAKALDWRGLYKNEGA